MCGWYAEEIEIEVKKDKKNETKRLPIKNSRVLYESFATKNPPDRSVCSTRT